MRTIAEGHPGQHTQVNQPRLLRTADQINLQSQAILNFLEEIPAVRSLSHRTGGGGDDLFNLMAVRQITEPTQRVVAALDRRGGEFTCFRVALPQAGGGFLRLFNAEGAQRGVHGRHQQVGRVGADVDGSDPTRLARAQDGLRIRLRLGFGDSVQHRGPGRKSIHSAIHVRSLQTLTRVLQIPAPSDQPSSTPRSMAGAVALEQADRASDPADPRRLEPLVVAIGASIGNVAASDRDRGAGGERGRLRGQ